MNKLPVLLISDIHNSTKDLKNVLTSAKYNTILCCGDIEINNEISSLISYHQPFYFVKGNCDVTYDYYQYGLDIAKNYEVIDIENKKYFITHGHLQVPFLDTCNFICTGHTHIPLMYKNSNNQIILNPGSISRSRSSVGNTYIIIYDSYCCLYDMNHKEIKRLLF